MSPIADTTTTSCDPLARSRTIRRATRLMRSAPATDEPPNFITTRGPGMRGILAEGLGPTPPFTIGAGARQSTHPDRPRLAPPDGDHARCASTTTPGRPSRRSPVARSTRARSPSTRPTATTSPPTSPARPSRPAPASSSCPTSAASTPTTATSRCGSPRTGSTRSPSTTSAGPPGSATAGPGFEFQEHVPLTTYDGLRADVTAAAAHLRAETGASRVFTIGFCMGGRLSFLSAGFGAGLAGVIGFYGWPVGPARNGTPAPADVAGTFESPVLAIFGGADEGIGQPAISTFEAALAAAGVRHEVTVYPKAPHSFFDRKADEFSTTSAKAWDADAAASSAPGAPPEHGLPATPVRRRRAGQAARTGSRDGGRRRPRPRSTTRRATGSCCSPTRHASTTSSSSVSCGTPTGRGRRPRRAERGARTTRPSRRAERPAPIPRSGPSGRALRLRRQLHDALGKEG